jgi:hypothetical protein
MVLRDGSYVDDLIYGGGGAVTVKVWDGRTTIALSGAQSLGDATAMAR